MENKIMLVRLLFWCFVPVGIFVLVQAIRLMRRRFCGEVLLEIPFAKGGGAFCISAPGIYAIWQKGRLFKRTPVEQFKPQITSEHGDALHLKRSWLRPHVNGFSTGRMELFTFFAHAGNYTLDIVEGSSVPRIESALFHAVLPSMEPVNLAQHFLQVRASQPFYYTLFGMILAALSGFCIIGSFVLGFVADKIFSF